MGMIAIVGFPNHYPSPLFPILGLGLGACGGGGGHLNLNSLITPDVGYLQFALLFPQTPYQGDVVYYKQN